MKKALIVAALLSSAVAAPAMAAPITYNLSGTFTGTIAGNPFTVPATFTGVGNTNNTNNTGFGVNGILGVPLTSFTALSGGTTYTISTPTIFYLYPGSLLGATGGTRLGFGFNNDGNNALGIESPAFNGYNGLTSFAPTPGITYFPGAGQSARFDTDQGAVVITSFEGGTFSATAVPEPATWAMMMMGFGMVGFGLRAARRNKVTTRVAFA